MPYCSTHHSKLAEFRSSGRHSDVSIQVSGQVFKCHRVVLASESTYFDSMFGEGFKEGLSETVILHEIDALPFDTILECMYSGRELHVDENNVYGLLQVSDFLGVANVKRDCIDFILSNLQSVDVLGIFDLACSLNMTSLMSVLCQYILRHLAVFVKKDTFLELHYIDLNVLLKQYRSWCSPFKVENFLLDGLIRWVYYSRSERKKYAGELIEMVDFKKITPQYVGFLLDEYNSRVSKKLFCNLVLKSGSSLKKAVIASLLTLPDESTNKVSFLPVSYEDPKFSTDVTTVHVYLETEKETNYTIFSVDNKRDEPEWYRSSAFYKARGKYRQYRSIITLDKPNYLYCYENYDRGSDILEASFHAYSSVNFSSNPSHVLTPLPVPRQAYEMNEPPRICGVNGGIYLYESFVEHIRYRENLKVLLPNFNEEEFKRAIYFYNCDIDRWFPVPEMKATLSDSYMLSDGKLVYLIGGKDSKNHYQTHFVQAYDPRTSQWMKLRSPTYSHRTYLYGLGALGYSGCAANGKIHLYNRDLMQVYDPVAGGWEKIREYSLQYEPRLRMFMGKSLKMAACDNLLWVFEQETKTCEIYDLTVREWRTLPVKSLNEEMDHLFDSSYLSDVVVFKSLEF